MNAHNLYALEQFIAAAGAFFGLAPQKLLIATRATPPETGADLAAMVGEANTAAAQQCAANGDPPPVTFETSAIGGDPSGYSAPVGGITRIRYGGGRTFAQIEIVGDLWLFSIGVREHTRVTVDSALSLARSIAARTPWAPFTPRIGAGLVELGGDHIHLQGELRLGARPLPSAKPSP